jgi:hypothetical protein
MSSWLGTAALLLSSASMFRVATAALAIATVGIVVQFVRTRRLVDVANDLRLPPGACRPRLFLSISH